MIEPATFAAVLDTVREHTAHLLGTTISYDEDDWAAPTDLPGWTRSHVAAHLVEGAVTLMALIREEGRAEATTSDQRRLALERRALSAGLTLQISLDETAGQLQSLLSGLEHDERQFSLPEGWCIAAHEAPLLRLREIVIHHCDLVGQRALDLPEPMLQALLAFEVRRPRAATLPPVLLLSDEGYSARIGPEEGDTSTVIGPSADLLLLLARGVVTPRVSCTDPVMAWAARA